MPTREVGDGLQMLTHKLVPLVMDRVGQVAAQRPHIRKRKGAGDGDLGLQGGKGGGTGGST